MTQIGHDIGHPCEHATLQCDAETRAAVAAQVRRLEALVAKTDRTEDETACARQHCEALYVFCSGTFCNCRIQQWYRATRAQLGNPIGWWQS